MKNLLLIFSLAFVLATPQSSQTEPTGPSRKPLQAPAIQALKPPQAPDLKCLCNGKCQCDGSLDCGCKMKDSCKCVDCPKGKDCKNKCDNPNCSKCKCFKGKCACTSKNNCGCDMYVKDKTYAELCDEAMQTNKCLLVSVGLPMKEMYGFITMQSNDLKFFGLNRPGFVLGVPRQNNLVQVNLFANASEATIVNAARSNQQVPQMFFPPMRGNCPGGNCPIR